MSSDSPARRDAARRLAAVEDTFNACDDMYDDVVYSDEAEHLGEFDTGDEPPTVRMQSSTNGADGADDDGADDDLAGLDEQPQADDAVPLAPWPSRLKVEDIDFGFKPWLMPVADGDKHSRLNHVIEVRIPASQAKALPLRGERRKAVGGEEVALEPSLDNVVAVEMNCNGDLPANPQTPHPPTTRTPPPPDRG